MSTLPDWDNLWWKPSDVKFTRDQVRWLIFMLPILKTGRWPRDPNQNTTDAFGKSQTVSFHAPFENPCMFAAEIEQRLERTGLSGKLLYYQLRNDCTWVELEKAAKDALYYCCGWRRKSTPFTIWKSQRVYRLKKRAQR